MEMTPQEKARIIIRQSLDSDEPAAVLARAVAAEAIRFAVDTLLPNDSSSSTQDLIQVIRKDFLWFANEIHEATTPTPPQQ